MSKPQKAVIVRVSVETAKALQAYADEFELPVSLSEAAEELLKTAVGRRAALAKYAAKQAKKRQDPKAKRALAKGSVGRK